MFVWKEKWNAVILEILLEFFSFFSSYIWTCFLKLRTMLQHYTGFCSGLPGHADVIMGRQFLSCSFLWKRSTNSLWLSSRLKVRLKLVSNTWWTPATMSSLEETVPESTFHLKFLFHCVVWLIKQYFCTLIFVLTKAFEERCEPSARLSAAEVIACCQGGSGLRWHRHHHHLFCPTHLVRSQNNAQKNTVKPALLLSYSKGCKSNHNQTQYFTSIPIHVSVSTLLLSSTLKSSSWLCCVMRTLSAEVMQPLQAKQSFSVIFAFSSFCLSPSCKHMVN